MPDFSHDQPVFGDGFAPDTQPASPDPLERLLLADGAQWRTYAPDERAFTERTALLLLRQPPHVLAEASATPDTVEDTPPMAEILDISQRGPAPTPPPPRRRAGKVGAFVAIAAAVAIVGMMAAIFQLAAPGRGPGTPPAPTPTPVPHVTHSRGHWQDVTTVDIGRYSAVYVAPSDPNVVYRVMPLPSGSSNSVMQRSDDAGKTWVSLPSPTQDGTGSVGMLVISPLDAHTVFLLVPSAASNPNCPTPAPGMAYTGGRLYSGGYSCTFQYVSRDGGLHWSHPGFPIKDQHLVGSRQGEASAGVGRLQAQGATLYTTITGNLNGEAFYGSRLVASGDGGTTWRLLDATLAAQGQTVVDFLAVPDSTTLFASTLPQNMPAGQDANPILWRSDDAGAHWTQIGPLPDSSLQLAGAWRSSHGLVLYALGRASIHASSVQPWDGVITSVDGGRTWQVAPLAGIAWSQIVQAKVVGVLSDGSLALALVKLQASSTPPAQFWMPMATYPNDGVTLAAWRLGDASWFQLTPPPGAGHTDAAWIISAAGGAQTVWIVYGENGATTLTLRRCSLS